MGKTKIEREIEGQLSIDSNGVLRIGEYIIPEGTKIELTPKEIRLLFGKTE